MKLLDVRGKGGEEVEGDCYRIIAVDNSVNPADAGIDTGRKLLISCLWAAEGHNSADGQERLSAITGIH